MEAFIGGKSRGMQEVLKRIETVAQTQCAVMLCGETGTGEKPSRAENSRIEPEEKSSLRST